MDGENDANVQILMNQQNSLTHSSHSVGTIKLAAGPYEQVVVGLNVTCHPGLPGSAVYLVKMSNLAIWKDILCGIPCQVHTPNGGTSLMRNAKVNDTLKYQLEHVF